MPSFVSASLEAQKLGVLDQGKVGGLLKGADPEATWLGSVTETGDPLAPLKGIGGPGRISLSVVLSCLYMCDRIFLYVCGNT